MRKKLQCDGHNTKLDRRCNQSATYIDTKGYLYCMYHAAMRLMNRNCRKLKPHELKKLEQNTPIKY